MAVYWVLADNTMKVGRLEQCEPLSEIDKETIIRDYAKHSDIGTAGIQIIRAITQEDMPIYKKRQCQ